MKRKGKFVTPRVTQSVQMYLETDLLVPGSTMYDQTLVSTAIGVENYSLGDGESSGAASYIEYDY